MGSNIKLINVNGLPLILNNKFLFNNYSYVDSLPATNILDTSFTANWELLSGATDYILEISLYSNFNTLVSTTNVGNVNTYNVTNLLELTNYYYRLTATVNGVILPIYSDTISLTTLQGYNMDVLLVSSGSGTSGTYSAPGGGGGGSAKLYTSHNVVIDNPIAVVVAAGSDGGQNQSTFYNLESYTYYGFGQIPLFDRVNQSGYYACVASEGVVNISPNHEYWIENCLGHVGGNGYALGSGTGPYDYNGRGGGGAGDDGDGNNATSSSVGTGGTGRTINIDGVARIYGRGGDGTYNSGSGSNATANTGNGASGRGVYNAQTGWSGRNGGSGIVRIKYLTSSLPTMTGGTKTTYGSYTIHTFTTSGVFQIA